MSGSTQINSKNGNFIIGKKNILFELLNIFVSVKIRNMKEILLYCSIQDILIQVTMVQKAFAEYYFCMKS